MDLTASSLTGARRCLYPYRPSIVAERETSAAADLGTEVHEAIALYLDGVADPPRAFSPEAMEMFDRWREWWADGADLGLVWRPEVPLAVDVETGAARILPSNGQRDYAAATATEVPGTADAVAFGAGLVHVRDWKTSRHGGRYVEPAPTNYQLLHNALCVCRIHRCERARVGLVYLSPYGVREESAELDVMDLDAAEIEIGDLHRGRLTAEPRPWTVRTAPKGSDDWCKWCAVRRSGRCPSRAA